MIKQRSRSLSDIDRTRLIRIVDFLESEMRDYISFDGLTRGPYETQGIVLRNAERFVENIVNAGIDIAKIVLASSGMPIPQTYGESLSDLALLEGFDSNVAARLSQFAKLRNVVAYEYLDLRFARISRFIVDSHPAYRNLAEYVKSRFLHSSC
jgi:uncharacterized protein YutE (UPF0331/DUF86 family)